MRSLKNRNACRTPENSAVMRLLIMPVENSVGTAKRRSREAATCAAMTAAHQRRSVLYCAFHVCRAVRKTCGMGCVSVSESSSGCRANGSKSRRTRVGMAAKRKTSAGKIFWPASLKKGKRKQEYSPCKTLNSSRAGSMHKSSSAVCMARLHAAEKQAFPSDFSPRAQHIPSAPALPRTCTAASPSGVPFPPNPAHTHV